MLVALLLNVVALFAAFACLAARRYRLLALEADARQRAFGR